MVTITNGEKTFRITAGAVKPYMSMGFYVVTDEELEEMKQVNEQYDNPDDSDSTSDGNNDNEDGDSEDADGKVEDDMSPEDKAFIADILEKPLSQWTNNEVKEFVKVKNIDTSGAQKVSQVRDIIKAYLEEEQKNNV